MMFHDVSPFFPGKTPSKVPHRSCRSSVPGSAGLRLRDAVAAARTPAAQAVVLAVGPEGGWVDYEVQLFQQHGFVQARAGNIQKYTMKIHDIHQITGDTMVIGFPYLYHGKHDSYENGV